MSGKRWSVLIALLLVFSLCVVVSLVYGASGNQQPAGVSQPKPDDRQEKETDFRINRFTSPETESDRVTPARKVPEGYKLMAATPGLELYSDASWQEIAVRNRANGYVWTSVPRPEEIKNAGLNREWEDTVKSPFIVEYFNKSSQLLRGSLLSLNGRVVDAKMSGDGFRVTYELQAIGIRMNLEVKLERDGLVVRIPNDSIEEKGTERLASVQPYPFFGSVKEASVPGYMFIPDGSGALIRFQETKQKFDEPFQGKLYGEDASISTPNTKMLLARPPMPVSVPVFGIVHGVKQNGFIGILEDGKFNAEIIAYPSGVNTPFNWTGGKFIVRRSYFQPTSKNMGGFNTFQNVKNVESLQIRYLFLSGGDADYVGMAKSYRDYLQKTGLLDAKTAAQSQIPLLLEVLGAEKQKGLIGSHAIKMTSFDDTRSIVDELHAEGVGQMSVVLRGWNNGGMYGANPGKFPVESALGGEKGLARLQSRLKELGYPLYLFANYSIAYGNNDNFSPRTDTVRKISNELMKSLWWADGSELNMDVYFIQPAKAAELARQDAVQMKRLGMDGVSVDWTGTVLFSDYSHGAMSRAQAANEYSRLADTIRRGVGKAAWYKPNDYMFPYVDQMFETPMSSSQYMYVTDTVPFLQLVLHGFIDYFAPFENYNASPQESLLQMVEYGAYPSYIVTEEPSWKLKNTMNDRLFTTAFQDWKGDIASVYKRVNDALNRVQTAPIQDRRVLDWGVVETVYGNGVHIVVNYRSEQVQAADRTIPAKDFAVWGGSAG